MDPFELLQTSLGPALHAIDQAGKNRLLQAQIADQRAYEASRTENQRGYNRLLREDERRYAEQQEEKKRKEKKDDAAEERLRTLRTRVAALGGDPTGKTEEQLAAMAHNLEIEDKIKTTAKMDFGSLVEKAKMAGISTPEALPASELVRKVAEAEQDRSRELAIRGDTMDLEAARKDPSFQSMRQEYGKLLAQRDQIISQLSAPIPEYNPGMTRDDELAIGRLAASDPSVIAAFRINKIPNAEQRLRTLASAGTRAALQGLTPEQTDALAMAMSQVGEKMVNQGRLAQFNAATQAYLMKVRTLPSALEKIDAEIKRLETIGDKGGAKIGSALQREPRANLISDYLQTAQQTMPGVGKGGKTDGGTTALPPSSASADQPQPKAQDLAAGALSPVGSAMSPRDQFNQRAADLFRNGGAAKEAIMLPFYEGVSSALNIQPQQVGGSVLYRTPRSILQSNLPAYSSAYDALPDDVKNAIIMSAIQRSYENPRLRSPAMDLQNYPTPTPFE